MSKKVSLFVALMILAISLGFPISGSAESELESVSEVRNFLPNSTVVLANEMDARFSQDFSVLLKHLRLEWVVLDSADVPDSVRDKNLVLLGHPDAEYSGELIRGLLAVEEVEMLRAATEHHVILEKESPWTENRNVIICSGADLLLTRNAAEEAIRAIIAEAPPASDWIRTTYDFELNEGLHDYIAQLQYEWEDVELPLEDLTIDVRNNPRGKVISQQAVEDVERLFYLFSHGYSGYAFFNQQGEFEQAKTSILQELSSRSSWSSDAFAELLHEHLSFIIDCHMSIGDYRFGEHSDFWYDTQLELRLGNGGFQFVSDGTTYTLVSINDADPAAFILPSLNQQGEPIYRLGLLSQVEPPPLLLTAVNEDDEHQIEIKLQRSDFDYYSDDFFSEDILGGIPVVRVRSFSDNIPDELNRFVQTAGEHRSGPVVILDIRGNGGGNEHWPSSWIQSLTGKRPGSVFVFSELESKTSMIGRANAFAYWDHPTTGSAFIEAGLERHTRIVESFESGQRQPHWTGPRYPQIPLIPNDTTVIVVTNDQVASSGEGMVMRISQVENVVVVGENTMGALTFGNVSLHQLPNSGLMVWFSINLNLFPDQEFREAVGLSPDLWVPAADAVNYAVAAVRRGTITTYRPLSSTIMDQDFTLENPYARDKQEQIRSLMVISGFAVGGLAWAFFYRKQPLLMAALGGVWIVVGSALTVREKQPVGTGFLLVGIICLVWGGFNLIKVRQAALESEA